MAKPMCVMLILLIGMGVGETCAQALVAPRAVALGAYDASVKDSRGFVGNPAGLVTMKDWDFTTATYLPTAGGTNGFVFHGFGLGKRFFDDNAIAFQYAPGASLDFVIPASEQVKGLDIAADKRISYGEPFAAAYARRLGTQWSAGVGVRMRRETVSDPQYVFHDTTVVSVPDESSARAWLFDCGVLWSPAARWTFSAVARSAASVSSGGLKDEFKPFALPATRSLELGLAFAPSDRVRLVAEGSSLRTGALGCEYNPVPSIALRGGIYMAEAESPLAYAVAVGAGWSFDFLEIDLSYLRFLNRDRHAGTPLASDFDSHEIEDITLNRYTADRLSIGLKVFLGNVRESLARIEEVRMIAGIYPSSYEALAYRPIAAVRVRNISSKAIQLKAGFYVEKLMDAPTETPSLRMEAGEVTDIPLTAVFNEKIRSVHAATIQDANVYLSATPAEQYEDHSQTRVLIHGNNDWDGNVTSLRYFVTPNDPAVIRASRDLLVQQKDSLDAVPRGLGQFQKAKVLFNGFAGKLLYVNDPKQSADYVQYPSETLSLRGGDCDDLTVCFVSLLSSVGISTAFVDVVPPDYPEKSHIYMLVDTGVEPRYGDGVAQNPKRYIIRKSRTGTESIWVPVESTVITRGFDDAWSAGAQEYFDDVEVGLGLVKGWVRIVDVY
jgi:hypothetical protein